MEQNKNVIINVKNHDYDINIGYYNDEALKDYLLNYHNCKILVITDTNVYDIYREYLGKLLKGFDYNVFAFEAGEESKTFVTYEQVLEKLSAENFTRQDLIIAFGGGIPGDITGFVASTYLRGLNFISIPTTLLSMVDSSVGGKNGINLLGLKNQVGTFYFPKYVHIDIKFLNTLPIDQINNGLAEIFKYAILTDKKFFDYLSKPITEYNWASIIARCLEIKLEYVINDVKDNGKRQFLNLGHTFGHAIEALSEYKINHGLAVGIGIIYMAQAAYKLGYAKENFVKEIKKSFINHNMLIKYPLLEEDVIKVLKHDKKIRGNEIAMIIPIDIGGAVRKIMPIEEVKEWIRKGQEDDN